jgi:hypothetical protein
MSSPEDPPIDVSAQQPLEPMGLAAYLIGAASPADFLTLPAAGPGSGGTGSAHPPGLQCAVGGKADHAISKFLVLGRKTGNTPGVNFGPYRSCQED